MKDFKNKIIMLNTEISNLAHNTQLFSSKIHKKASSVLETAEEDQINREIAAIQQIFKKNSNQVKERLKEIKSENDQLKNSGQSSRNPFEFETRNSHWQALTNKLRKECANFRNAQVSYRNMEHNRALSQYRIENPGIDEKELKAKIQDDETKLKSNLHVQNFFSEAKQRNQGVKKIAEEINDLCMLIDELHEMVKGQAGMVDRIEVKMAGSVSATGRAKESLKNALRYQISAMKLKRIMIFIFLIFILLVIVYFGFKMKGSSSQHYELNRGFDPSYLSY